MAVKRSFLLFAYAIKYKKAVMPAEVGINIVVRFPLDPLRFERATVGNDPLRAGARRKDLLTPTLFYVLLENLGKFLTCRPGFLKIR